MFFLVLKEELENASMTFIFSNSEQVTSNISTGKLGDVDSKTIKQLEEPYFLRKIQIKNQPPTRGNRDYNNETKSLEHGRRMKTKPPLDFLKVFMQKACMEMKKKDEIKYGHSHAKLESVRSTPSGIRGLCGKKRADPFREFLAKQYELIKQQRQENCD